MKKTILITTAFIFTIISLKAQFVDSGNFTKTVDHVIIGDNLNRTLWTRHINGKSHLDNSAGPLLLNWGTKKPVHIGSANHKANLYTHGEMVSTHHTGARFVQGDYGLMIHNNGTSSYFLLTNSGNKYGTWNNLRPFRINNAAGTSHLSNTLHAHYGKIGINQTAPKTDFHLGQQLTITSSHTDGYWGVIGKNSYYDNGNKRIVQDEVAEMIYTDAGDILFRTAPSGPANSIIDQTDYIHTMKILNEGGVNICGTIRANEVIVEDGWWCDFVFEDDYDLPTIEEQLASIEDNGHLANFQAEEEMSGNISLGDVTSRQQQTIEEQMLYIGQLHNMMKEMNDRIVTLESKLSE